MDRGVVWNSRVVFHNLDVPLDTGNQICTQWHVVVVMDMLPCLLAQALLYALQGVCRCVNIPC